MKLKCSQIHVEIIPESDIEIFYLERLLGVTENGQPVYAKRVNCTGSSEMYGIELSHAPMSGDGEEGA